MSLLTVKDLQVYFPVRGGFFNRKLDEIQAVRDVSFSINQGETFGLVGESGSGKSTTGRAILGLEPQTGGTISYQGHDVTKVAKRQHQDFRRDVQMIFQDSFSSLNPQKRIASIISEPLRNFENLSKNDLKLRVLQLLDIVGLSPDALYKYPHQFSGGQQQRIGIARAVATHPKLIIADEPVSALDLSVQAQVLNFMKKIQAEFGISYLFISHDLGVIRHMCDRIAIMTRGEIVEIGTRADIYQHPIHIYTKQLLEAIPQTDVDHREQHREARLAMNQKYHQDKHQYYDQQGQAFPLVQVSETHWVSLPPNEALRHKILQREEH
ncbi:Oligopeptide transport ATP-binding protein OppF [Fructilactobacillus florum 8D]|uniref:Oligopeptide transport ATP-binding protein OppF n=1 Tax=Fructilactobacillus florum 8D TaxID=1221538 RepID=W9ED07_9LACO|nr:ATP-binding cassette domain-containing protein [Fructilactobacillus florum]EKK20342.1 Oligopeptide transport ATP-binding protein OppF [Fructilactobacillus florum 2F]ETO39942.1 Oligopeptide transport ATP-binding protein OppF [Fructilactobacillus florum 8D]